jgi:hypothetical protein
MRKENKTAPNRVTRRTLLAGGIVGGLACLLPREILAEIAMRDGSDVAPSRTRLSVENPNLYAFAGPNREPVIALTWSERSLDPWRRADPMAEVHIHMSSMSRSIPIPLRNLKMDEWSENGYRIFTGSICGASASEARHLEAIVLETPAHLVSDEGTLEIWAELRSVSGKRQRVGSPFLSELVASNGVPADLYHTGSPQDDRSRLTTAVAKAVAVRAREAGNVSEPEQYGRRIALDLLPDVLRFDPALPSGFTFASRNGRHPAESSDVVVNSILSGSPYLGNSSASTFLKSEFPYFVSRLIAI